MTTEPHVPTPAQEGRPIVLTPVQPGLWLVIGGGVLATMGPLFGFLVGTMMGSTTTGDLDPIFLFLILGILVGGAGVGMMVVGAFRLMRHRAAADRVGADRVLSDRASAEGATPGTSEDPTGRPDQG